MNIAVFNIRYLLFAVMAMAWAGSGICAVSDTPETWSAADAAGWVKHDLISETIQNTLALDSGGLKLTFKSQSIKMPPEEYVFEAGAGASSGNFTGDYVSNGVTEIRFELFCERQAEVSLLLCNSESSRVWRYRIPDIQTGVWLSVSVPINMTDLYCLNDNPQYAMFEADLRHVTSVGVAVEREQSLAAQSYWLDNFTLVGRNASFAAWMEQFPKPAEYGAGNCSVLPGADLDGDGFCNYDEWIAGTSAGDVADRFVVAIEQAVESQTTRLRWKASPGRRYQVWSTADLGEPFVPVGVPMDATVPENTFEEPGANGNISSFYKITVECPSP